MALEQAWIFLKGDCPDCAKKDAEFDESYTAQQKIIEHLYSIIEQLGQPGMVGDERGAFPDPSGITENPFEDGE